MDTAKLIMLGKMSKELTIGEFKFKLVTPQYGNLSKALGETTIDPIKVLLSAIEQIDDVQYVSDEQKAQLEVLLRQMQANVVNQLLSVCNALSGEQAKWVEEISSKKA